MKKQLFAILLVFTTVVYYAQSGLSNLSFETWSNSA